MSDAGWSSSPSLNGHPSRWARAVAIVVLPLPETPMTTRIVRTSAISALLADDQINGRGLKGRLMDEILDAEYKVVEHQIAPPLDPSPRWRFQRLARTGARHRIRPRRCQLGRAGKAEHRRTAHNLSLGGTEAIRAHPRPNAGGSRKRGYRRGMVSASASGGRLTCWGLVVVLRPRPYYRLGLPHGQVPDTAHRFFARFEISARGASFVVPH